MKNFAPKKSGAAVVVIASMAYSAFRISSLLNAFSAYNLFVAFCEITTLILISTETVLLSAKTSAPARKQDENVLLESAKSVLFTKNNVAQASAGGSTQVTTQTSVTSDYATAPLDACVFAEDASSEELRRCFLSLALISEIDHVYVVDTTLADGRKDLCKEFNFHVVESFDNLAATTQDVLICRGTDVLYPDACKIARTYDLDAKTFLELRSVYSDERALGMNGIVTINDKRQLIRESLATRKLATWSTGPAIVPTQAITHTKTISSSEDFFLSCERGGIHGALTEEIVSEEISHEQTVSEVEWRALDFSYLSHAWRNSYKGSPTPVIGWGVKFWSMLVNISFVRRIATVALVLIFVLQPASFAFVNKTYLVAGAATIFAILIGGYCAGDHRAISIRMREFYFDIEAVFYNVYKSFISEVARGSDRSIVKKLPSVSSLLVLADIILVYRVIRQSNDDNKTLVPTFLKNVSLFSGYILIVTLLVGLGMVLVRQGRSAMRREISRGANLDAEPVSMIDLSPGGAGCISVASYEVGSIVKFDSSLPSFGDNIKFSCAATVRSCVEWNGSYRLGLSFVEINQDQKDVLETYCSIVYPHAQSRATFESERARDIKMPKVHGIPEKRFLSYAASFIALGAIIFSNLSTWR